MGKNKDKPNKKRTAFLLEEETLKQIDAIGERKYRLVGNRTQVLKWLIKDNWDMIKSLGVE